MVLAVVALPRPDDQVLDAVGVEVPHARHGAAELHVELQLRPVPGQLADFRESPHRARAVEEQHVHGPGVTAAVVVVVRPDGQGLRPVAGEIPEGRHGAPEEVAVAQRRAAPAHSADLGELRRDARRRVQVEQVHGPAAAHAVVVAVRPHGKVPACAMGGAGEALEAGHGAAELVTLVQRRPAARGLADDVEGHHHARAVEAQHVHGPGVGIAIVVVVRPHREEQLAVSAARLNARDGAAEAVAAVERRAAPAAPADGRVGPRHTRGPEEEHDDLAGVVVVVGRARGHVESAITVEVADARHRVPEVVPGQ
mmetsp:Transcript_8600/g.29306  ORF Transcript_8600/g.29306 Transcript_8600/m.29306 type:complete len:311 (+) Transcript_8600:909-1841(+)